MGSSSFDSTNIEFIEDFLDSIDQPFFASCDASSPSNSIQVYLASHPTDIDPLDELVDAFHEEMYGDRPRREKKKFSLEMRKIRDDWQMNRLYLNEFRVSRTTG